MITITKTPQIEAKIKDRKAARQMDEALNRLNRLFNENFIKEFAIESDGSVDAYYEPDAFYNRLVRELEEAA